MMGLSFWWFYPHNTDIWVMEIGYNVVNKANLVQNLFLVYLSISTCFKQSYTKNNKYQVSNKHSCLISIYSLTL